MPLTGQPAATPGLYLKSILALAAGLRLAAIAFQLASGPATHFFNRVGEVSFLAESLLSGHGLSSPWGPPATGPSAFLAPGYPLLIAAIFRILGAFSPASAIAIMLLQAGFGVFTVWIVVRIAAREFGPLTANIAGAFLAVGLPFLWLPAVFWDTSLCLLLLAISLALALRCARQPTHANWAFIGISACITLLINPSLALTLAALFLWTLYQARRSSLLHPLLAVLLLLAIYSPWPIRNARVLHAFIPLRSNLGFELWKGNRPGAAAIDDAVIYPVFNRAEFDAYAAQGEVAYMRAKSTLGRQEIEAHPDAFLRLTLRRFARYWTGTGSEPPAPILAAHEIATTLLALLGFAFLVRARRFSLAILLALPLLLFPLPYYITHAELRFRILLEPVTTLLAAHAVGQLAGVIFARRSSSVPSRPSRPAAAHLHPVSRRETCARRTSGRAEPSSAHATR